MVRLVFDCIRHFRHDGHSLGYLLAPLHRPRYVLDARAHCHPPCGVLAGISCGYLILSTTFRQDSPLRKCSVRIWGFRGPLGAFIAAWGGIAMITSAPFDNWWHDAYGLDVKILSPPHIVLALGIFAVHLGALILIVGQMNRAEGAARTRLLAAFLYVRGMMLVCLMVMLMEEATRTEMHSAHFYWLIALVAPALLAGTARATQFRWSATVVAGIYMAFLMLMSWILPLFPAEPKGLRSNASTMSSTR